MTKTVVVGLLLAFLLFTPQGHQAALIAFALIVDALPQPAPDPAAVARHAALEKEQVEQRARIEARQKAYHDCVSRGDPAAQIFCAPLPSER